MQQLGQYVVTLTTLAIVCGIVLSFFRDGTIRKILKILCGIVLITAALRPLPGLSFSKMDISFEPDKLSADALTAEGKALADNAKEGYIQQHLEAYILDKASALGADITPVIRLDESCIPIEVTVQGAYTGEARQAIAALITNDLGVPEEDQKWTGET